MNSTSPRPRPLFSIAITSRLFAVAASALAILGASESRAQKNVLIVIADDLNRMISPLGDPNAITPNLERLAAQSVCFENATCQFPFCSPSRASLFTGLYPWWHGNLAGGAAYANPHQVLPERIGMPEYFRSQGYWTASFGKTEHHYQARNWDVRTTDFRHSQWKPNYNPATLVHSDQIWARGITGTPFLTVYDLPPEEFIDGVSATAALNELTAHLDAPDPDPFFVVVGFDEPHSPWEVPQSVFDLYDPSALVLDDNARGNWASWAWKNNNPALDPITEERRRDLFHAYLAGVTLMDSQLGRLLDFLDDRALWTDTIVIFASDNGYSLCEHERLYAKRNVTRENISVPIMIHAPDESVQDVMCERQIELQDLFPTLIDLCDLPPYPHFLNGRSIKPLLLDPGQSWPHVAKSALASPNATYATSRVVQFGPLKIAEGTGNGTVMYLDHASDPLEQNGEYYSKTSPATDPKWMPLLASLDNEFGFAVGTPRVFYHKGSLFLPDRDDDGIPDSEELGLSSLGFTPWYDDAHEFARLHRSPVISLEPGPALRVNVPGFTVTRPPGAADLLAPLQLLESDNLESWLLSPATYHENADGSFYWDDASPSAEVPRKFFRLAPLHP